MYEKTHHPCNELLRQWGIKRDLAQYYFTALLRLSPDDPDREEKCREISEKLFFARIALRQVSDQLQSCQQEHP